MPLTQRNAGSLLTMPYRWVLRGKDNPQLNSSITIVIHNRFAIFRRMSKCSVLITAGPTREPIDPVRFLSNRSSGKMGYAIAEAARAAGHFVTLISGPVCLTPPKGVKFLQIETAVQLRQAVLREAPKNRVIIMAAAVADYSPLKVAPGKIKKQESSLLLRLTKTPDILAELGRRKSKNQVLIGFAAET